MATIKLGDNVKAAMLITVGDVDADGKIGAKCRIYADIPLDGTGEPKEIVDLPEWEPVDPEDIATALGQMMKWGGPILAGVVAWFRKINS